ncbi:hypothetical protein E2C01_075123 [Portunus trituberculatus]|uniref:Uncharacterized protein n=1 Tax=Portunus trituberculatus TaxID=210409 RepID=A0A5B7IE53_PORTR|nr:hypothetical protein [Portunus trituberculatus]
MNLGRRTPLCSLAEDREETVYMLDEDPPDDDQDRSRPWWKSWNRKYVLLCGTCGASAVLLGTFYLIIYFVLRSYTSSLQYFETIPTYVPASVVSK